MKKIAISLLTLIMLFSLASCFGGGTNEWEIPRVGADIKIKCLACGRVVMLDRQDFIRMGKKVLVHKEEERA